MRTAASHCRSAVAKSAMRPDALGSSDPATTRSALERLLTSDPFTVAELSDSTPGGRLVLVHRLVREELLVVVAR
jgi:hypothetical protein